MHCLKGNLLHKGNELLIDTIVAFKWQIRIIKHVMSHGYQEISANVNVV